MTTFWSTLLLLGLTGVVFSDIIPDWNTCYAGDTCSTADTTQTICCVGIQDTVTGKATCRVGGFECSNATLPIRPGAPTGDVIPDWNTCFLEDTCQTANMTATKCCVSIADVATGKATCRPGSWECSDAPVPSKSGLPPPPQIPGRSFASANSFFLYALQDADQDEVLAAMVEANIKVVRIFITEIYPNEKATNNSGYPDVEPGNVGVFNSTILEAVDKLMYKAFQHKIKLNIALHDRYALCTWKCDAYARKYNLIKTPDGTNANVVEYYRNPAVNADLDARYAFIVNHQNKYFGNRPWKLIPEAIFAFDMENESQSYNTGVYPTALPLPNPDWACDRATALRAAGVHPRILLSTGGGADVEDSLITNHFACPALDIVPVHSYDVSKWDKGLNSALTLARQYNKLTFVQEYGATSNKAKNFASQIAYFEKYMLPHMIWEILKPNNPSDYEVYKDDTSTWDLLVEKGAKASASTIGAFAWDVLYGADAFDPVPYNSTSSTTTARPTPSGVYNTTTVATSPLTTAVATTASTVVITSKPASSVIKTSTKTSTGKTSKTTTTKTTKTTSAKTTKSTTTKTTKTTTTKHTTKTTKTTTTKTSSTKSTKTAHPSHHL